MKKYTLILLFCFSLIGTETVFGQYNFQFDVSTEIGGFTVETETYTLSESPAPLGIIHNFIVDMSDYVCEGDTIIIENNSNGTYNGQTITLETLWDAKWGYYITDPSLEWFVNPDTPFDDELWDSYLNEQSITIPNTDSDSEFVYHKLFIAPDQDGGSFAYGVTNSTAGCSRVMTITIKVRNAPTCLKDISICPGEPVTNDLLGINAGDTVDWSTYDPREFTPANTEDFAYTISNGTCSYDCTLRIEVNNPEEDITDITELCYDDEFIFKVDDYLNLFLGDTYPMKISIDGTIIMNLTDDATMSESEYLDTYFDYVISGETHGAGVVTIVYEYYSFNTETICTKTYNIEIFPPIEIDLPNIIEVCDSNFEELCGPLSAYPSPIYTYEWWGTHPELPMSVLLDSTQCFTPEDYGSYILTVTDEKGCTASHHFTIVEPYPFLPEIEDVVWCSDDLEYPVYVGWHLDPFFNYPCDYEMIWSYNGDIVEGMDGYQIPFMGEGTYCVKVIFSDTVIEICFEAYECCAPNVEFALQWFTGTNPYTIKINNYLGNIGEYDSEIFFLSKDCNNDGMPGPWEFVTSFSRDEDFGGTILFENLDPNCIYKVTHAVDKNCLMQSFIHTEYVGGIFGGQHRSNFNTTDSEMVNMVTLMVSPNPASNIASLYLNDFTSENPNYILQVYNVNGNLILERQVNSQQFNIDISLFTDGLYLIKLTNELNSYTAKLIKN